MLIKASDVRKIVHDQKMSIRPQAIETLSRQVEYLVKIACTRAHEDHRKRIDTQDFIIQTIIDMKNRRGIV